MPSGPADELSAEAASDLFKDYLARLRADPEAVAVTPPGRFLMPGDLEGSPALTFAPLDLAHDTDPRPGTLAGLMAERFEAYKRVVVTPFFRDHFARLDRQIVLVDALAALDAGAPAPGRSRNRAGAGACSLPGRAQFLAVEPVFAAHRARALCRDQGRPYPPHQP